MKKILNLIKSSLFLVMILLTNLVYGQEFKILATKGYNTLDGNILIAGKKLNSTDVISVSGYLALIYKTGKTHEVKIPGKYKVSDLANNVLSKNASITKKYSEYVLTELTKTAEENIHTNYQKNMKVTGSVDRAVGSTTEISILLPKNSYIIENINTIMWNKNPKVTTYKVEISNMFDDVILTKETKDTSLTFDLNSIIMPKDYTLMVRISSNDLKSNYHVLKVLNTNKNNDIITDYNILKEEFSEESALNHLMKASFYAENNLFIDAKESFEKAIKLEPEIEEYQNAYKSFLAKNGML